ncbi:16104_t:CDS:2, partial [Rhizophagus irregularis]
NWGNNVSSCEGYSFLAESGQSETARRAKFNHVTTVFLLSVEECPKALRTFQLSTLFSITATHNLRAGAQS